MSFKELHRIKNEQCLMDEFEAYMHSIENEVCQASESEKSEKITNRWTDLMSGDIEE